MAPGSSVSIVNFEYVNSLDIRSQILRRALKGSELISRSWGLFRNFLGFPKKELDGGRKLNVGKMFRRLPEIFLKVWCTFNLRPDSTGNSKENAWVSLPSHCHKHCMIYLGDLFLDIFPNFLNLLPWLGIVSTWIETNFYSP